jgi:hypothetical protein
MPKTHKLEQKTENLLSKIDNTKSEKIKKSKSKPVSKKKTLKCKVIKKLFIRNQNRIGGRDLPASETNKSFYSKLQLPPAPIQFAITNYLKSRLNRITSNPENVEGLSHLCDKLEKNGGNGVFKIHSTVTAKLVTTMDIYMQHIFENVKYLNSTCHPPQKVSEIDSGIPIYVSQPNKTLTHDALYKAFVMLWNKRFGPTEQKTFNDISSAFVIAGEMHKWKTEKKKLKLEKDKSKLTEKIESLKNEFKSQLEKQCSSKLYCGEGFLGTLKRYQIGRQSSYINLLIEVIARSFLEEIIRKSLQLITLHKSISLDERTINLVLNTCGFAENL